MLFTVYVFPALSNRFTINYPASILLNFSFQGISDVRIKDKHLLKMSLRLMQSLMSGSLRLLSVSLEVLQDREAQ
jgi:hypothetical protein